ncbi:MAG: SDR family oxidoreductase [Candidatus Omnitrophica bacterium]|nr:SDR family oxidoreductase [Candidatus Omnitrophota bacterium]
MEIKDLQKKIAVVTGGSRGIGFHIAQALHEAGAVVAITGRNPDTLKEAAGKIGERCTPFVCDQRKPPEIIDMAKYVQAELGVPDILVNNAGVFRSAAVVDMPLEMWNEVIETNLTGVFLVTQAFLPAMIKKNRADIFMISSMSGKKGDPETSAYNASKFGLQGFAQALMYEVRKYNIRVMVLNPSSVDTGKDAGPEYGAGLHLHAADLARTIVHLAALPGRTMIRDMDIYGTNPTA